MNAGFSIHLSVDRSALELANAVDGPASDASGTDVLGKILLHHDRPKVAAEDELTHVLAAVVSEDLQAEIVGQVEGQERGYQLVQLILPCKFNRLRMR